MKKIITSILYFLVRRGIIQYMVIRPKDDFMKKICNVYNIELRLYGKGSKHRDIIIYHEDCYLFMFKDNKLLLFMDNTNHSTICSAKNILHKKQTLFQNINCCIDLLKNNLIHLLQNGLNKGACFIETDVQLIDNMILPVGYSEKEILMKLELNGL